MTLIFFYYLIINKNILNHHTEYIDMYNWTESDKMCGAKE